MGEVQVLKAAPSRLQAKVELSVDVKLKVALDELTVPVGPDVIVVSGAVLSTVTVLAADVVALFDGSKARAEMLAEPSAMEAEFQTKL